MAERKGTFDGWYTDFVTCIVSRSSTPADRPKTMTIVRQVLASEKKPLSSLYRGLTPNLLGNATSWSIFFMLKSRVEHLLLTLRQRDRPTATDYLLSPALAGAATTIITNPIWVVKTRMLSSDKSAKGAYPSMSAGIRTIWKSEGGKGFYRGLGVSLIGVSHGAVQFAVYEPAKRMYASTRLQSQDQPIPTEATMFLSSAAKLVAGAVTYPYQVLRSRLQNYQAEERFGKGFRGVVRKTWREEGVRGFYRGLVPGVVRVMPATWVTFLVYENVKFYLPRWVDG